jgi:hypothetical protein
MASLKAIKSYFPRMSNTDAKALKAALDGARGTKSVDEALETANKLIEGYGIEAIRGEAPTYRFYYQDIVALYVNTGDTYTGTVVYDVEKQQFQLTTFGDWVEWATSRRTDRVTVW